MEGNIMMVIFSILSLIIGFVISRFWGMAKFNSEIATLQEKLNGQELQSQNLRQQIDNLNTEKESIRTEKERLALTLTRRDADYENLRQKNEEHKQEVDKLQEKFVKDFEVLANKILEEKSTKFTEKNKENIANILNPLQEKIKVFEEKVDKTHKESIDFHAALRQQIIGLKEVHSQMSKETLNLTKALKGDSKMQGNWGELILEKVLEKSGLEKDREYFVQKSFVQEDGSKLIPDVVIHLPDNKKMIVDSKVSLVAYERYVNEEDEVLRATYLKEHIQSINRHIDQLSAKNYYDLYQMETPDFVLLFVPIETAFSIAINEEKNLYDKAYTKNIVIVTPSTLLATLRTIDSHWVNKKQQENAIEIAEQAGALYDKFVGFVNDLITVGKRIDDSKKEYSEAMNKLIDGRGDIIGRVENLKKMGAKAKKSLPESILKRAELDTNNVEILKDE